MFFFFFFFILPYLPVPQDSEPQGVIPLTPGCTVKPVSKTEVSGVVTSQIQPYFLFLIAILIYIIQILKRRDGVNGFG